MAGTGTTGAVAMRLGRKFILIEKEERYVNAIRERLKRVKMERASEIYSKSI
jgi:DNA modification methylase